MTQKARPQHSSSFQDYENFLAEDITTLEQVQRDAQVTKKWGDSGAAKALHTFHLAARTIPAYQDFLNTHHIKAAHIRTPEDLSHVPPTSKSSYIRAYPLADLLPRGKTPPLLIAASSGTTGKPTYWPRYAAQEEEAILIHDLFFREAYQVHRKRTLVIIAFPFGVYVSGVATALPSLALARRYPMTIITAGLNKANILDAIKTHSASYDQTLLIGHPFFVKDVIEEGSTAGYSWTDTNLRIMLCSEAVSEDWRDYVLSLIGATEHPEVIRNTYGSSEFLLMGTETPLTITLRRALRSQQGLSARYFDTENPPGLFQYHPLLRHIEEHDHALLFTSWSGIPLIRYQIEDAGSILSVKKQESVARELRITLPRTRARLPIVALHGRLDHTALFYGINIYPEHIHRAISTPQFFSHLTGKFQIDTQSTGKTQATALRIFVELRHGNTPPPTLQKHLEEAVLATLRIVSMEYRFLEKEVKGDLRPHVTLCTYQDPQRFPVGVKPRYIAS